MKPQGLVVVWVFCSIWRMTVGRTATTWLLLMVVMIFSSSSMIIKGGQILQGCGGRE